MTDVLLWLIFIELTLALLAGGYALYHIQSDLAIIALQACAESDDVEPAVLEPEILTADDTPPAQTDEPTTVGTFTGPQAWN